jgi:hypothetical protein
MRMWRPASAHRMLQHRLKLFLILTSGSSLGDAAQIRSPPSPNSGMMVTPSIAMGFTLNPEKAHLMTPSRSPPSQNSMTMVMPPAEAR